MHSATFLGEVKQGQLLIGQPLADFEGKQVLVTLIAADTLLPSSWPASAAVPRAAEEAEILEDIGRFRDTPRPRQTVSAEIVAVGRRPARLSGEEE
ncbi:MAG: hypothetical protein ACRELF_09625 [Gemmataceae bacterium]